MPEELNLGAYFKLLDSYLLLVPFFLFCILIKLYYEPIKFKFFEKLCNSLEDNGVGYASALVDIYFYGYLKIVLPNSGGIKLLGLQERVKQFRSEESLEKEALPVARLFLLVTSSGYCPTIISQYSDRIKLRKNLSEKPVISRNGVSKRTYKTTIYKVYNANGQHVSVAMEAASSLRQLYEASFTNSVLKDFTSIVIKRFLTRLQEILQEHEDCRDKCEVIYYDDRDKTLDLANVIIERIQKCKESNLYLNQSTAGNVELDSSPDRKLISHSSYYWKYIKWACNIMDEHGLSYGRALADTYFYGYLKIVLPDIGSNDLKGIQQRIKHYKADHGIPDREFPVHKLFLLVTSSGYCDPDISDFNKSLGRIKISENLTGEPVLDRNGVKRRTYQTTVYEVYDINKKNQVYVVMESAPCLRQLYEASRCNSVLREFRLQIVNSFLSHTKKMLDENEDCRDKCEIIFCDLSVADFSLPDEIFKRINNSGEFNYH